MSLKDWVQNGWLSEHQSSREEIKSLLGLVDRDLRDSQAKGLGADWSFAIAYNAPEDSSKQSGPTPKLRRVLIEDILIEDWLPAAAIGVECIHA